MQRTLRLSLLIICLASTAQAQTWSNLSPGAGTTPTPRRYASATYDPLAHRMVTFGGQTSVGTSAEVWSFDLTAESWTDITPSTGPAPGIRRTPGSVYDPQAHCIVTWSGQGSGFFNDIWAFDLTTHTWTELLPPASPNPRYGVGAIYDPIAHQLVTFAGFTNLGRFNDTWRYDIAQTQWIDATPAGVSPSLRCLHSASYDAQNHRMIMYGGQQSGPLDDIWAFDLTTNTWTDLTPTTRPLGRFFTAHVYDARHHRATIFGGTRGGAGGGVTDEVWVFNLYRNEFIQMAVAGTGPTPREGSAGIYIESEDRMVVFGGFDGAAFTNEVWSLNDLSNHPTAVEGPTPVRSELVGNQPNPFNPNTTIHYRLARSGAVQMDVFDLMGSRVTRLLDGQRPAGSGSVQWDARDARGRRVPSGVYLVRLQAPDGVQSRKITLIE